MYRIDLTENIKKQVGFVATVFLLTFFFFAIFGPANPIYPAGGLDPSWKWALNQAYLSRWQWGRDIVFTFGPWGFVYTKLFAPGLVINRLVAWFAISLSLAIFVADRCNKSFFLFLSIALYSLLLANIDAILMAVCIFPALQKSKENSYSMPVRILYILTASMLGLGKSTFLILALVTVLLLDLKNIFRKSPPYNLVLFVVFTIFFYIAARQDITFFYSFLVSSFDIISGYGSAMNTDGPIWQLAMFLVLTVILATSVAKTINSTEIDPRRNISLWIIAIYLFFCFKNGFVRHDNHVVTAFSGLAITVFFIYSSYKDSFGTQWIYSFGGVIVVCFLIYTQNIGGMVALKSELYTVPRNFSRTVDMLLSPRSWYQQSVLQFNDAKVKVQAKYPLKIAGSVDILSSNQSAIIANDLKYIPRPIFQEFAVYTPTLAKINLEYFKKTPPDHFLFSSESIDGRHPNLSDGYIWPLLYKCYTLEGYIPSINAYDLVSKDSSACREKADNINLIASEHSALGDAIKVPVHGDSLIYAKLNFVPSIWGRLVGLIYKENPVILEISYSNGDKETTRIIPKMASSGFFIDSQIGDMNKLADRFTGHSNRLPTQLIVKHDGFFGAGYRDIQAQFYEYPVKEIRLFDSFYGEKFTREAYLLNRLVESSAVQAPLVQRSGPSRVDSHAPSNLSLNIDNKISKVEFEIGIRKGASDKFDGVCFEASAVGNTDQQKVLMTHCFSRHESAAEQIYKVSIQLPENTKRLYFKNSCQVKCNYAWAFYQNFKIESNQ